MPTDEDKTDTMMRVLLKVSAAWNPPDGLHVTNRYGVYVQAEASIGAMKKIERDPEVLAHEKDISTGRFL
jgi:hypothetical protein